MLTLHRRQGREGEPSDCMVSVITSYTGNITGNVVVNSVASIVLRLVIGGVSEMNKIHLPILSFNKR